MYVTPDGVLVDENERMPGDVPYNLASPSKPSSTVGTRPMDRWAGRRSTSPAPGTPRHIPPSGDRSGYTPTRVARDLTSSIPTQSVEWLKSEKERMKAYEGAMAAQKGAGWKWGAY